MPPGRHDPNMSMKILHIINTLGKGGAEKLLVQTLPYYQQEAGWEVDMLQITSRNEVPEYLETLAASGVQIHTLGARSVYDPSNIPALRRFLKQNRYDIIHVHIFPAMYWVPLALMFRKKDTRLVFTEHNTHNRRWDKWYFKGADRYMYHRYDTIVAITDDVKKNLAQWQPGIAGRIVTVFNGIDIASLQHIAPADRQEMLSSLAIQDDAKLLLMTARFDKQKDHRTLVEAMKSLPVNYYLLLAGDGPERASMELAAAQYGVAARVKFLGFRADVQRLMKTVDLNILSSNYEGLSGVTLEALCSGKPFLGSDVTGIQNVVPDARFLFEHNNAAMLAQQVQRIIQEPGLASAMGETALAYVKQYDIHNMVSGHVALYRSLHHQNSQ